jgi:hypothetical protein
VEYSFKITDPNHLHIIPELETGAWMHVFLDVDLASNGAQTALNERNHSVHDEDGDMHTAAVAVAVVVVAVVAAAAAAAAAESGAGKTGTQKMKRKLMKVMMKQK